MQLKITNHTHRKQAIAQDLWIAANSTDVMDVPENNNIAILQRAGLISISRDICDKVSQPASNLSVADSRKARRDRIANRFKALRDKSNTIQSSTTVTKASATNKANNTSKGK